MKTKKIIFIILGIFVLCAIFLFIDVLMLENGKTPIFSICYATLQDGGTKNYIGLGYTIMDYNILGGFNGYKVGFWIIGGATYDHTLGVDESNFF